MKSNRIISFIFFLSSVVVGASCSHQSSESSTSSSGGILRLTEKLSTYSISDAGSASAPKLLNAWIYSSVGTANEIPTSPDDVLDLLQGECGDRDSVMYSVLSGLGFQVRRVNFFNVPVQVGHSATEVYYGGAWHFFDSSLGLYFADKNDPDLILSIAEARRLYPNVTIMRSTLPAWQKTWLDIEVLASLAAKDSLYQIETSNEITDSRYDFVLFYLKETYIDAKYTVADHPNVSLSIPVDLNQVASWSAASIDGSGGDLTAPFYTMGPNTFYQPYLWILGAWYGEYGGVTNIISNYRFKGTVAYEVTLEIDFVDEIPDSARNRLIVTTRAEKPIIEWSSNKVLIRIKTRPPVTNVGVQLMTGEPTYFPVDNISISRSVLGTTSSSSMQ